MTNAIRVRTDRMKNLTEIHGLNESEAARRIGCSRQTYRRAIGGENVSAGFVAGACLSFGVPFDALFHTVRIEAEPPAA